MKTFTLKTKVILALVIVAAVAGELGSLRGVSLSWLRVTPGFILALMLMGLLPTRKLAGNRVRVQRMRLRLHLHPGRGQATALALWLTWSRFASFRESARSRPGLTAWQRAAFPAQHSVYIGRAQYRITLRIPVQEHAAVFGPPREGKSGWLARAIMDYPGSVVATSSKPDQFFLTSGLRSQYGRPVHVFNPQALGNVASTIRWNPLEGCEDEATAMRRADAFASAVSTAGTEDGTFWSMTASGYLRGMFHAAALAGGDFRLVAAWVMNPALSEQAEIILKAANKHQWAGQVAGYRGPAEKTNATVKMVMIGALEFMNDPALSISTLPVDGQQFDIDDFALSAGTLYMIAKGYGGQCALAPLFSALASEIQFRATVLGSQMAGGRLDPPLGMFLDECANIVPVPLPSWLADSGGQGVQIIPVFHGIAQMEERWGKTGAQIILDTSSSTVMLPGTRDPATLEMLSKLCGKVDFRVNGQEHMSEHDVLSPEMIRQLPPNRALIIRRANAPVIAKLPLIWKSRKYKKAKKIGTAVARITAAPMAAIPPLVFPAVPRKENRDQIEETPAEPVLVPDIPESELVPDDDPWSA